MELKQYRKDSDYSYSFGAFPTVELIRQKKAHVIRVIYHSSFENDGVKKEIASLIPESLISVNDKLIERLADKENVFVIGVFHKYTDSLDKDEDHVVLVNPSNMGNLGTIMRSTLGFGINNIAIIRPGVDCFDPKVVRSSMGAIFSLHIAYYSSLEDYQNAYGEHQMYKFMLQAKKSLREEPFDFHPLSLVFGNEATGIDPKYLDDHSLIIRHSNKIDSLNVTNAVSIALYEYSEKINSNKN